MDAVGEFLLRPILEPVFKFIFERVSFFLGRGLHALLGIAPTPRGYSESLVGFGLLFLGSAGLICAAVC